jgi:hypothetical protein
LINLTSKGKITNKNSQFKELRRILNRKRSIEHPVSRLNKKRKEISIPKRKVIFLTASSFQIREKIIMMSRNRLLLTHLKIKSKQK